MFDRKIVLKTALILTFVLIAAVPASAVKVNVQAPSVPAALPFLWMQENAELPADIDLNLKLSSDHQRGVSLLAKNDIDFLITGTNVGANAYNRGVSIKLVNVNTWAIDYLLTNNFKAENWQQLKDKSLALPLKGGPLDFLIRYLAQKNSLNPEKELNLVYRTLPGAAQLFMSGDLDAIVLPEPLATVSLNKSKNAKISMDIQEEWGKIHGDPRIPFVALFANSKFSQEHPQITETLNSYYSQGVKWVNKQPQQAAELASRHFEMPAPLLKKSFSRVDLNIYPQKESKKLTEQYFNEILKIYPDLLGGSLPDEEFYY